MTFTSNSVYIDILPEIMKEYDSTIHRKIDAN